MLAQSESEESKENYVFLTEREFPIELRMQSKKRFILSWDDFAQFIQECPNGLSELAWLRSWSVWPDKKPIAIASLTNPLVAPFFFMYGQATAEYNYGYLYPGGYGEQPAVLMDAFAVIRSAVSECQVKAMQMANKRAREAEERLRG